jgi:hypothetical protein
MTWRDTCKCCLATNRDSFDYHRKALTTIESKNLRHGLLSLTIMHNEQTISASTRAMTDASIWWFFRVIRGS